MNSFTPYYYNSTRVRLRRKKSSIHILQFGSYKSICNEQQAMSNTQRQTTNYKLFTPFSNLPAGRQALHIITYSVRNDFTGFAIAAFIAVKAYN